jgi:LuxR family transcriptional regulator, regulator of acetate metabolism
VTRTAAALFGPAESRLDGLLTRREREVLDLMTSGATNIRIAEQLVISEGTVKSHVKHILRKLRAGNRAEAVARYLRILLREQEDRARA